MTGGTDNYTLTESGDSLGAVFSQTLTGTDRYGLLQNFSDVSNTGGNTPGNMNFLPFGQAFEDPAAPDGPGRDSSGNWRGRGPDPRLLPQQTPPRTLFPSLFPPPNQVYDRADWPAAGPPVLPRAAEDGPSISAGPSDSVRAAQIQRWRDANLGVRLFGPQAPYPGGPPIRIVGPFGVEEDVGVFWNDVLDILHGLFP